MQALTYSALLRESAGEQVLHHSSALLRNGACPSAAGHCFNTACGASEAAHYFSTRSVSGFRFGGGLFRLQQSLLHISGNIDFAGFPAGAGDPRGPIQVFFQTAD